MTRPWLYLILALLCWAPVVLAVAYLLRPR
jgi:hypothetical protein